MIIDATDAIVGRMASFAAKKALMGENVEIVNCGNAYLTGSRKEITERFKRKRGMGIPSKGPFIPRKPFMLVKRMIRGMIPYKTSRGRAALGRIKCYSGVPDELKDAKIEKMDERDTVKKVQSLKRIKINDICRIMGAKI